MCVCEFSICQMYVRSIFALNFHGQYTAICPRGFSCAYFSPSLISLLAVTSGLCGRERRGAVESWSGRYPRPIARWIEVITRRAESSDHGLSPARFIGWLIGDENGRWVWWEGGGGGSRNKRHFFLAFPNENGRKIAFLFFFLSLSRGGYNRHLFHPINYFSFVYLCLFDWVINHAIKTRHFYINILRD